MKRILLAFLLCAAFAGPAFAVEAFIVFKGATKGDVSGFYATQAAADAAATEAGSDHTAVQGAHEIGDYVPQGSYWNGTKLETDAASEAVQATSQTDDDKIKERRGYLFGLLREHEKVGGKISVWHASRQNNVPEGDPPAEGVEDERLDESKRFPSYGRWVEANVRAALVDENLTNEAKWAFLKAECEIPGETWYWLHKVNGTEQNGGWYATYADNNRADWKWKYTTGTTTTSNSRTAVLPPSSLTLALDTTADWVRELQ